MPFIVTTKRPDQDARIGHDQMIVTRVAVATLEETPGAVMDAIHDLIAFRSVARMEWALMDPSASGFKVGPLPDGTTITVEPAEWHALARESEDGTLLASALQLGERIEHWPGVRESIIATFTRSADVLRSEDPTRTPLDAVCAECGHEFRFHFGERGPCIHGASTGEASVCACAAYRPEDDDGRAT